MISTEIIEPDQRVSFRQVYFRDQEDRVIRRVWIDETNRIVRDYLYEYDLNGLPVCIALYGQNLIDLLGVKEFFYDEAARLKTTLEFKIVSGIKVRIKKIDRLYDIDGYACKVNFYGSSDEPVGYQIYAQDGSKHDGFVLRGSFNMRNEPTSAQDFGLDKLF